MGGGAEPARPGSRAVPPDRAPTDRAPTSLPATTLERTLLEGRASEVAPGLLGAVVRCVGPDGGERAGIIVEVEAYEGADDPASHAFGGRSARNGVMFGPAGHLYVYRSYGIHWCANVSCGPEGVAMAVLLRAVEPAEGVAAMWPDRPRARRETDLGSGPGKLCAALGITGAHDGVDLLHPDAPVRLEPGPLEAPGGGGDRVPTGVVHGPRVGISKAVERPWRFALAANPHVSRPRTGLVPLPRSGSTVISGDRWPAR